MAPARQRVRRSARLEVNARTRLRAMELPQPSTSSRRGKGRGRGANPQAPRTTPKIIVHWMRPQDLHRTDTLVQHLATNSADVRILFYEGKKSAASSSSNEDCPSGKDKGEVYQSMAKLIFATDEQVLQDFPWYDRLHPLLFSNPTCGAKVYTSQPGVDHTAEFYVLVNSCGGAGALSHQHAARPELPPLNPHHIPTSAQPSPTSAQPIPSSVQPTHPSRYAAGTQPIPPPSLQHPLPPLSQHPPPPSFAVSSPPSFAHRPPPPLQYPPPLLPQPGAGGGPIDDPDGDMDDDPHADDNDDDDNDGPFGAPLGNALDTLDRDFEMCDDADDGLEVNSSRHRVFSLDSPPKVVGHKRQYAASPSPPRVGTNSFILPRKVQTCHIPYIRLQIRRSGSQIRSRSAGHIRRPVHRSDPILISFPVHITLTIVHLLSVFLYTGNPVILYFRYSY
ncbi:hypothetical protein F4604DRAFT_1922390 [Suillus subluteus]|nr:hypothetical protein F4604DRAFT_1922390 [Suillus subluteus]